MSTDSSKSNKLELHFELLYIESRNIKDVVRQWQDIYDAAPNEAIWTLIQFFVDATGYLDIKIDLSSKNFRFANMIEILKRMSTKNHTKARFILNSSKLRENVSLFLREIVLANRENELFFEPYIQNVVRFLFQLAKKKGEIFYTTGSVLLVILICILIDVGQDYSGNGIKNVTNKHAPYIFVHVVKCLEFHDCVQIMCTLFLNIFENFQKSFFQITHLKNIILQMLMIADPNITLKVLLVMKSVLEKDQPQSDKLYVVDQVGAKQIMLVLLHDAIGANKRIAVAAHEIINIVLNNCSKSIRIKQHDYTPLLIRMCDTNQIIRKLAGSTFHILHHGQNIMKQLITFYMQYPKQCGNITYVVDACFPPHQIETHVNDLLAIMTEVATPDEYKSIGGQMLLHLYKNILREYKSHSTNLLRRISELLFVSKNVPHLTLSLLEIVTYDTTDADSNVIIPIIEFLAELVTTHTDYNILCTANVAFLTLSTHHENLFMDQFSHVAVVQSIYNDYNLSRMTVREQPDAYKICLVRFRAAAESTECVYDYFNETFQSILGTLFNELTAQDVDDTVREHQIVLYTTLMNAAFAKTKCVSFVKQIRPFVEHLITMLADSSVDSNLNALLTKAVIPGICNFYIMASYPVDLPNNLNRIEDIPSYVYSNIGNALTKISATISEAESNMRIMKMLLEYWITLHQVQKVPRCPEANKILILYGNVNQLSDLLETLLMSLYHSTPDHALLFATIGQSFVNLHMFDKPIARNYTNSLYKYLIRRTTEIQGDELLILFTSILLYVFSAIEIQLKVTDLENKNRLVLFNYLHNYVKRLVGNRDDRIIQSINRILQFDTISQQEIKTLNNIKTQLGC